MLDQSRNNNCSPCDNEITEVLKKLVELQRKAVRNEINEEMCDADFLGDRTLGISKFNTRPLQLYTHEDNTWFCPIDREDTFCEEPNHEKSCVFRVEKVEDGTATFRALVSEGDRHGSEGEKHRKHFKSTDSFITIKLMDIAAFRCLKDTFVELCI